LPCQCRQRQQDDQSQIRERVAEADAETGQGPSSHVQLPGPIWSNTPPSAKNFACTWRHVPNTSAKVNVFTLGNWAAYLAATVGERGRYKFRASISCAC